MSDPKFSEIGGQREDILKEPIIHNIEWNPESQLEKAGLKLVQILQDAGGEAYFVGGYPRDLVMSRMEQENEDEEDENIIEAKFNPHDIDIATDLLPDRVEQILLDNNIITKAVGKQFQVINALVDLDSGERINFEIATFRVEGDYGEDRKPHFVEPTRDKREDVKRRDFTINALLFNPVNREVVDYVNGVEDIKNGTLEFVGNAEERVKEDPLRMLRYARIRNKYHMNFSEEAQLAISENSGLIKNLSAERIKEEMDKIFQNPRSAFAIGDLARIGCLKEFLPEVSDLIGVEQIPDGGDSTYHKEGDVFRHEMEVLRAIDRPEFLEAIKEKLNLDPESTADEIISAFYKKYPTWGWANLFHDVGKKETQKSDTNKEIGKPKFTFHGHADVSADMFKKMAESKRIAFSNDEMESITSIIREHINIHALKGAHGEEEPSDRVKRKMYKNKNIEAMLWLSLADDVGNIDVESNIEKKIEAFNKSWKDLEEFREEDLKNQEIMELGKEISSIIINVFTDNIGLDNKKGLAIIDPVKKTVLLLLLQKKINKDQIEPTVLEIKNILEKEGITNEKINNINDLKNESRRILESHYQVSFDEL